MNIDNYSLFWDASGGSKEGELISIRPKPFGTGDFTVARTSEAYTENADGTFSEVDENVPKYRYVDGRYGIFPEDAATNQIRNNSMQGAVVGTPGTLPTEWGENLRGLTREVVSIGKIGDVDYIDIRFHGTATSGGVFTPLRIMTEYPINVTHEQVWANSAFLKLIDSTALPVSIELSMGQVATPSGFLEQRSGPLSVNENLDRYISTETVDDTVSNGNPIDRIFPAVIAVLTEGQSYDFTIRIGMPQMELGATASSVIKTTGTTETRDPDEITKTDAVDLIGQTEGEVYCEFKITKLFGTTKGRIIWILSDGTPGARIQLFFSTTGNNRLRLSSTFYNTIDIDNIPIGFYKARVIYNDTKIILYLNDDAPREVLRKAVDFLPLNEIGIGSRSFTNQTLNDSIYKLIIKK